MLKPQAPIAARATITSSVSAMTSTLAASLGILVASSCCSGQTTAIINREKATGANTERARESPAATRTPVHSASKVSVVGVCASMRTRPQTSWVRAMHRRLPYGCTGERRDCPGSPRAVIPAFWLIPPLPNDGRPRRLDRPWLGGQQPARSARGDQCTMRQPERAQFVRLHTLDPTQRDAPVSHTRPVLRDNGQRQSLLHAEVDFRMSFLQRRKQA